MTAPFGFSVGDFIAVGTLAHHIIQAISENKGAAADYRSFVSTLRSLYSCSNAIKCALEKSTQDASNLELPEAALINGLTYETDRCKNLLNAFLDKTYKYTASLLPSGAARELEEARTIITLFHTRKAGMNRLEKAWRKVSWAVFRKEDVQKLERDLQGHLLALQMYEMFLQHWSLSRLEKSTTEIALVTRKTEVTVTAMFDLLKSVCNILPPQIDDKMNKQQPVFFVDALGRSIELPREFCVSMKRFHRHLEILFEGMPAHRKVVDKEYRLKDPTGMNVISPSNWHLKVTAGASIAMALVSGLASCGPRCPIWNVVNIAFHLQQGMIECFNPKPLSEVVKHVRYSCESLLGIVSEAEVGIHENAQLTSRFGTSTVTCCNCLCQFTAIHAANKLRLAP